MSQPRSTTPAASASGLTTIFNGTAYEWQAHTADKFAEWWDQTDYAKKVGLGIRGYAPPAWGSKTRSSCVWPKFGEIAMVADGHPKIYCYGCKSKLGHPGANGQGTSHMRAHLQSQACTKASGNKQQSISELLQKVSQISSQGPVQSTIAHMN